MNKTTAFASFLNPKEAKRIDEIHKRDLAAKGVMSATSKLVSNENQGESATSMMNGEADTAKEAGEDGGEGSKNKDNNAAA